MKADALPGLVLLLFASISSGGSDRLPCCARNPDGCEKAVTTSFFCPADPSMLRPSGDRARKARHKDAEESPLRMDSYWSDGFCPPPHGQGLNTFVDAIETMDDTILCVGGMFIEAGGVPVNCIAKWNGSSWEALNGGMNANVRAIAVSGSNIYAGGCFTEAGGVPANYIARWDGNSWSPLGEGLNGPVFALALCGSDLYAGGSFTTAGGSPASRIAKWDGDSWSALGTGLNGQVYAIEADGSDIFAGGMFDRAGLLYVHHIARWSEGSWHSLGAGTSDWVRTMAVSGSNLYAGGDFSMAGGVPVNRIARWDGSGWSPLGSGMNNYVYSIEVNGSSVYAGGEFTTAGGVAAHRIARWNTNSGHWTALGSGMNMQVCAIQAVGRDVFAGGWFTTAGGIPSSYFAQWMEEEVGTWEAEAEPVPNTLRILGVSPNPSTAAVRIALQSPGMQGMTLDVYDASGHRVFFDELENLPAGEQEIQWNGCDSMGTPLLPGVYFVRLRGGELCSSAKVVIVR